MKKIIFLIFSLLGTVVAIGQATTVNPSNTPAAPNDFLGWNFGVSQPLSIEHRGAQAIDISVRNGDGIYIDDHGTVAIGDFDASNDDNARLDVNLSPNSSSKIGTFLYMNALGQPMDLFGVNFTNRSYATSSNYGVLVSLLTQTQGTMFGVRSHMCSMEKPAAAIYGEARGPNSWAGQFLGTVHHTGSWTWGSDINLKQDLQDLVVMNDSLALLNVVTFDFNIEQYPRLGLPLGNQIGVIAQNVDNVFPSLVKTVNVPDIPAINENVNESVVQIPDFLAVSYVQFIPMLIQAYQERQELIDSQNLQIAAMESQLEQLQQLISQL